MGENGTRLTETDLCNACRNTGMMLCPSTHHMVTTDADGWCGTCDSPDVPQAIMCPLCQDA